MLVEAGDLIPGDGEVIEGIASVNEAAVTGESAPVIREAGGDRSAVTGGTTVLSDWIVVRITSSPGSSFLDRMIALVEGRGAAEDAQRDRAQRPARRHEPHLPDRCGDAHRASAPTRAPTCSIPVLVALFVTLIPTTIGGLFSAIGIAGMDRLLKFNVLAMSGRAVEAAGDVDTLLLDKTGTITFGNRLATEVIPVPGVSERAAAEAALLASLADETPEGRSIVTLTQERYGVSAPAAPPQDSFIAVLGDDPSVRRRSGRAQAAQGRRRCHSQICARGGRQVPWPSRRLSAPPSSASPAPAARRSAWPKTAGCSASSI